MAVERRVNWRRRARCNRLFLALQRGERFVSLTAKIVKSVALILIFIILTLYYMRHFDERPDWLPEFLTKRS